MDSSMTAASPDETALLPRLESVLGVLAAGNRFALAYSGGLDSRFLAHAAQRFGFEPVLLHIVGPHIPPEETDYARHWAASRELAYEELPTDPLDLALVASGDRRRCYACKRNLFSLLKARTDLPLCDGTNASDARQYRPGIRAVEELGILSPLASAGLTKADIHRCAALTGMEDPEQKARPCSRPLCRAGPPHCRSRSPASASPCGQGGNAFRLFRQGLSRFPPPAPLGSPCFSVALSLGSVAGHCPYLVPCPSMVHLHVLSSDVRPRVRRDSHRLLQRGGKRGSGKKWVESYLLTEVWRQYI